MEKPVSHRILLATLIIAISPSAWSASRCDLRVEGEWVNLYQDGKKVEGAKYVANILPKVNELAKQGCRIVPKPIVIENLGGPDYQLKYDGQSLSTDNTFWGGMREVELTKFELAMKRLRHLHDAGLVRPPRSYCVAKQEGDYVNLYLDGKKLWHHKGKLTDDADRDVVDDTIRTFAGVSACRKPKTESCGMQVAGDGKIVITRSGEVTGPYATLPKALERAEKLAKDGVCQFTPAQVDLRLEGEWFNLYVDGKKAGAARDNTKPDGGFEKAADSLSRLQALGLRKPPTLPCETRNENDFFNVYVGSSKIFYFKKDPYEDPRPALRKFVNRLKELKLCDREIEQAADEPSGDKH